MLERPKVYHNAVTGQFVMYMHIDGRPAPNHSAAYGIASVGIATCDTIDGDYIYQRHFRPLGLESRDIGKFIDDEGHALPDLREPAIKGLLYCVASEARPRP